MKWSRSTIETALTGVRMKSLKSRVMLRASDGQWWMFSWDKDMKSWYGERARWGEDMPGTRVEWEQRPEYISTGNVSSMISRCTQLWIRDEYAPVKRELRYKVVDGRRSGHHIEIKETEIGKTEQAEV